MTYWPNSSNRHTHPATEDRTVPCTAASFRQGPSPSPGGNESFLRHHHSLARPRPTRTRRGTDPLGTPESAYAGNLHHVRDLYPRFPARGLPPTLTKMSENGFRQDTVQSRPPTSRPRSSDIPSHRRGTSLMTEPQQEPRMPEATAEFAITMTLQQARRSLSGPLDPPVADVALASYRPRGITPLALVPT